MDLTFVFQKLGIALGLGLLVGLQRERAGKQLAGLRTFPLITITGCVCALLAQELGGWIVGAGFVALALMVIAGRMGLAAASRLSPAHEPAQDTGITGEVAMLLMFGLGAYIMLGRNTIAIAIGGGTAVLLYFKEPLHQFVRRIGETDVRAIMQFVLLSLVILPVLPNHAYGPPGYEVLNPFKVWLLVVLIVGISLGGYIAYKVLGPRAGTVLAGVLGGLISSTATTVSYARRSRENPGTSDLSGLVVMIASTIVFVRVLALLAIVAPSTLAVTAPPLLAMMGLMVLLSVAAFLLHRGQHQDMPAMGNPTQLGPALLFGGMFAVVLLATAVARDQFGAGGLYAVALISGLTDMDAITLSVADLLRGEGLDPHRAWRVVLAAVMSNIVFKGAVVAAVGDRRLLVRVAVLFGLGLAGGAALLAFWPA